jgi:hypothetical protein
MEAAVYRQELSAGANAAHTLLLKRSASHELDMR